MWKLEPRSSAAEGQFVYGGTDLLVSRNAGAWLVIPGDVSVSRRHASLTLQHSPSDAKRGKVSTLILEDLEAKNGTYVRQSSHKARDLNASLVDESHRMTPGSKVHLQHQDIVRFGLYTSYRVVFCPLLVATSMLPKNESVLQDLTTLGATFCKDWSSQCTHLVMNAIKLSAKVACALASGGLIVTPAFLSALVEAVKEKKSVLPLAQDFLPVISEPSIQPSPSHFVVNSNRKSVFAGKTFYFGTEKGQRRLAAIIRLAGGECGMLEARHSDTICCGSALLLRTIEDASTPSPTFLATLKALKLAGLHVIPESDIVLAVLYCTTERFCNPNVSQQLVLDRPTPHTQTQSSVAVFALETQDVATSAPTSASSVSGSVSAAPRSRPNIIPETPSSTCNSRKSSAIPSGNMPRNECMGPQVTDQRSPQLEPADTNRRPLNAQLPNGDRSTQKLNAPSYPLDETVMAHRTDEERTSKKRCRSAEASDDESACKRAVPSKSLLPDTQDIEVSQDMDEIEEGGLNISTFAPPHASTQIYENEPPSHAPDKPVVDQGHRHRAANLKNGIDTDSSKTPSTAIINMNKKQATIVTCIPPTPTPPSQTSPPSGADQPSTTLRDACNGLAAPGKHQPKTVLQMPPSLESLESFPMETLGRTTQFCADLQTAPLPSLETPCLDSIAASRPPPDNPSLPPSVTEDPTPSRDPFAPLDTNAGKDGSSKALDVFQLPTATVRRRKVQQVPSEPAPAAVSTPTFPFGIKRSRSTVELEEAERQKRAALPTVTPAVGPTAVKQELCTPSGSAEDEPSLFAVSFSPSDGFIAGKRQKLQKSPSKTTDARDTDSATYHTPDPKLMPTEGNKQEEEEEEVKPRVKELEENITVCRTLLVSLVLRTSILGDEYQLPQQNTSAESTNNFKRFRKVRHGRRDGLAVSMPRIIGGRDLVPHTSFGSSAHDGTQNTGVNPRSLWFSQHPDVTRQLEEEDREREEDAMQDQMDFANSARSCSTTGRRAPASRQGSIASFVSGGSRGNNSGATQSNNRVAARQNDFSQYQMPTANVRKRVPRTGI